MTRPQKGNNPVREGREYIPVTVPFTATPAGETPGIDRWAHRAVWTERMLATLLEDQVKGGKWPLAEHLLYGAWVHEPECSPRPFRPIHRNLLTGEPYAGKPPVRFGPRW